MTWVFTLLFIILGLALIVAFKKREQDEEKAKLAITGILAVTIVLVIARMFIGGEPDPIARYDPTIDEGIGEFAARDVARAMEGQRVVILAEMVDHNYVAQARLRGAIRGFEAAGKEILGTEDAVAVKENGELILLEEGMPREVVENALREYPNVDAIFSLAGFPPIREQDMARLFADVQYYAIDEFPWFDWQPLVSGGAIAGIVMSYNDADWTDSTGTPEEVYNRRYQLVTRRNLDEVRHRVEMMF